MLDLDNRGCTVPPVFEPHKVSVSTKSTKEARTGTTYFYIIILIWVNIDLPFNYMDFRWFEKAQNIPACLFFFSGHLVISFSSGILV